MTKTKSGRELEATHGYKGPAWARKWLGKLGFGLPDSDSEAEGD